MENFLGVNYLGVKLISAAPMILNDAAKLLNRANSNFISETVRDVNAEGYLVQYEDGYKSWSPKDVFDKAYRKIDNLTFGLALEALKQGKKVAREGWNSKGMFVFMRPADELHVGFVAKQIKSLPQSVKDYYYQDCIDEQGKELDLSDDDIVKFTSYLCMKAADGTIVNGWLASQTDMLSEDWCILN